VMEVEQVVVIQPLHTTAAFRFMAARAKLARTRASTGGGFTQRQ
jgi:hypothetical protein